MQLSWQLRCSATTRVSSVSNFMSASTFGDSWCWDDLPHQPSFSLAIRRYRLHSFPQLPVPCLQGQPFHTKKYTRRHLLGEIEIGHWLHTFLPAHVTSGIRLGRVGLIQQLAELNAGCSVVTLSNFIKASLVVGAPKFSRILPPLLDSPLDGLSAWSRRIFLVASTSRSFSSTDSNHGLQLPSSLTWQVQSWHSRLHEQGKWCSSCVLKLISRRLAFSR